MCALVHHWYSSAEQTEQEKGKERVQPYETSEQESTISNSNSSSSSISPRASLGQKQRHLRWKPFHALFMLFINALCVVCATINSSKNGCFLRLYEEMKHFSFFANFSVFLFLCCSRAIVAAAAVAVYFISFFFLLKWKQQNVISKSKQNPRT